MRRSGLLVATIVLSAGFLPVAANAALTECKSTASATMALSDDAAIGAWRTQVTNNLGVDWANFDLARNKQFSQINLVVVCIRSAHFRAAT